MNDKELRILILAKLYELNRKHTPVNLHTVGQFDVSPEQLNFAFQYLGTSGLIDYSYSNSQGVYNYTPHVIKGKGIDLLENLVDEIPDKIKNEIFTKATQMLDKVVALSTAIINHPDFLKTIVEIFDKLIAALQTIL